MEDEEKVERAVIVNAYAIARELGIGYATPYKVIDAMINNPLMFGIAVPHTSDEEQVRTWLREWEALARSLGYDPEAIASGKPRGPATEVERALALVRRLILSGRPWVIIYEDTTHGLLRRVFSRPERLFGAVLEDLGNGKHGFRVPWVALLRRMLNA